jgi:hypothetical protein
MLVKPRKGYRGGWSTQYNSRVAFDCDFCGKRFYRKLSQRKNAHDFCSSQCWYGYKSRARGINGQDNPTEEAGDCPEGSSGTSVVDAD